MKNRSVPRALCGLIAALLLPVATHAQPAEPARAEARGALPVPPPALAASVASPAPAPATSAAPASPAASTAVEPASDQGFWRSASAVKLELGGLTAGIGVLGARSWRWGTAGMHAHSEGWFGFDTGSGGMDKLGHAYSSYVMTEFLRERLRRARPELSRETVAWHAALMSAGLMSFVELFDGMSRDHGFAYEDMVMNAAGIGLAYWRGVSPGVAEALDYRLQYAPSERSDGYRPLSNYEGQTYWLVLKPAGFAALRDTPLKYLELQLGYRARGFSRKEGYLPEDRRRTTLVAIGLNLDEMLFKPLKTPLGRGGELASTALHYVQIPAVAARINTETTAR